MILVVEIAILIYIGFEMASRLVNWREDHAPRTHEESWGCEACGMQVYATTIEGIIEGMRIHETAIWCPGDEDDPY